MARDLADPAPANMVDAQFSLPYAIAALAHRIEPAAAWYEAETLGRPDLVGFAARVRPEFDELIDAVFRETRRPAAAISMRTPGGTWRSPTIEHPLGSFERPIPAGGVEAKFLANVTPALGTRRARTSLEAILALASAPRAKDVLLSGMAPSGAR